MNAVAQKRYAIYGIKKNQKVYISDEENLVKAKAWAREVVGGLGRKIKGVRYTQAEVWDRKAPGPLGGDGLPVFGVWIGPLGSIKTTDGSTSKAKVEELATASIKTTGTYQSRAAELVKALGKALCDVFGAELRCEARGTDPAYWWDLPNDVQVRIDKSRGADPKIWVFREDPINKPPNHTDWKNEWFERDYDDKLYHVGRIALYAKEQVESNRKKLEEHNANVEKFNTDMQGTLIPTGVSVERNPKTGFYELHMTVTIKELSGEEVKFVVAKCKDFKQAVEPFEKKEGGSDA
jgi:hypothetical protein